MFFKRKTASSIVADDRKLIENNSKLVGKLTLLVNDDNRFIQKLKDLEEKLKYLKPVQTKDAMKADISIGNKIDDLKIELSCSNGAVGHKAYNIISEIMLLLVNRKD